MLSVVESELYTVATAKVVVIEYGKPVPAKATKAFFTFVALAHNTFSVSSANINSVSI